MLGDVCLVRRLEGLQNLKTGIPPLHFKLEGEGFFSQGLRIRLKWSSNRKRSVHTFEFSPWWLTCFFFSFSAHNAHVLFRDQLWPGGRGPRGSRASQPATVLRPSDRDR